MGEFDELVKRKGVLMAGRFGPDWQVADQKLEALFFEVPAAAQLMTSFAGAIRMQLLSLGVAMKTASPGTWAPLHGWAFASGDYTFAMHGACFLVAETAQVKSIDEVLELLKQVAKPTVP